MDVLLIVPKNDRITAWIPATGLTRIELVRFDSGGIFSRDSQHGLGTLLGQRRSLSCEGSSHVFSCAFALGMAGAGIVIRRARSFGKRVDDEPGD